MKKIFFIAFIPFIICSCTVEENIIWEASKYGEITLEDFIDEDFDYMLVVNQGRYISDFMEHIENDEYDWLGEKIYFVKDNLIIKQINISYFVSEPDRKNYISFFLHEKVDYIKRYKGDTRFKLIFIQDLGNSFKWYFFR
ncbi:MAG: hypothetical protein P1P59_02395 [Treponemataceae bacterium]